jgi:hypothetical protein
LLWCDDHARHLPRCQSGWPCRLSHHDGHKIALRAERKDVVVLMTGWPLSGGHQLNFSPIDAVLLGESLATFAQSGECGKADG